MSFGVRSQVDSCNKNVDKLKSSLLLEILKNTEENFSCQGLFNGSEFLLVMAHNEQEIQVVQLVSFRCF